MKQGFPSIEGLRAYMAWWVVVGHVLLGCGTLAWLDPGISKWLVLGGVAVNVFIVASGFVITHLLLTKQEPYGDYIVRRLFRIAPIYVICIVLAILTTSFYMEVFVDADWGWFTEVRRTTKQEEARNWWAHLALHLTMLHGLVPMAVLPYSASTFLAPAWSLSLEWQFYLLAPGLIAFLSKNLKQFLTGTAVLLALGWAANHWLSDQYTFPSMLLISIQWFLVGIVSRMAIDHIRGQRRRLAVVFALMATVVVAVKSKEMLIWMVFFAFAIFEARDKRNDRRGEKVISAIVRLVASNRLISTLGKVSYSTYLVHMPFFALVAHLWGVKTQDQMVSAMLVAMALLPFVSLALYKGVEAPFIALGRRFVEGRRHKRRRLDVQVSAGA